LQGGKYISTPFFLRPATDRFVTNADSKNFLIFNSPDLFRELQSI